MSGTQIMSSAFLVTWLTASVRLAGPVLLAALGETFSERGGVLNLGIEGTILLGALASFLVSLFTGLTWMALLVAMVVGVIASIFLAWMYVTVKASQVVAGLVFNVLALGIASAVYRRELGNSAIPESIAMFHPIHIPFLSDLPLVGPVLFGQTILLYLTLVLVLVAHFVLFRTNFGLALRACGENPAAADSAGISVDRIRYMGVLISESNQPGMAGALRRLVLAQVGLFSGIHRVRTGVHCVGDCDLRPVESGESGRSCAGFWSLRRAAAFAANLRNANSVPTLACAAICCDDSCDLGIVR